MASQKVSDYTIATLGTHSALQILKGAHDEGFKTLALCLNGKEEPYRVYGVADEIISLADFKDILKMQDELIQRNVILIPHASFIAYIGFEKIESLRVPYYGNKKILRWESDRSQERVWLENAGLRQPKIFRNSAEIDRPVIVKFHGAFGGKGYFIAKNESDFHEKIKPYKAARYVIQEYILGVPIFIHYFQSSLSGELEIMGFDKRYESNVDSLGRVSARDQMALEKVDPSYVIVGNFPMVIRESYLPSLFSMGRNVVAESKKIAPPQGMFGPFCLETVITPDEKIFVFEISARIVAGTNPFINGSPYTWLKYNEPMSTGRRIAREIKNAILNNQMDKVLG